MKIKLLAMDIDGTLTDGRIYISADGECMKAFDVKDGYGIVGFMKLGGIAAVITGRRSTIAEQRCAELGITELHQGVADKTACLAELARQYGVAPSEIAYIGDDLNDLDCMRFAGVSGCPADAVDEVKEIADFICSHLGGRGAVRELIDWLIKLE